MAKPARKSTRKDFSKDAINKALTPDQKIAFYRDMVRIRHFEMAALKEYNAGRIGGFLHLYNGQESIAVISASLMGDHDHMITAYRDHGHGLSVGMNMDECMAELLGKIDGCSKGKGGSMHFFAPDKNYWGGHGIVGGQTPLGLGLAYGVKYLEQEGCCLCYLGDGAINQGAFHESLNMASLHEIPVVFIIENNGYSMGTSQERSSSAPEFLAQRAEGYLMDWDVANGENVYELRSKLNVAMERARKECKPTLLEIDTYRYYGHSIADANHKKYREAAEIDTYKKEHDPINLWKEKLIAEGVLNEDLAKQIDKEAKTEARASVKFAHESPVPTVEDISKDIYWEIDNNTESAQTGRYFFND